MINNTLKYRCNARFNCTYITWIFVDNFVYEYIYLHSRQATTVKLIDMCLDVRNSRKSYDEENCTRCKTSSEQASWTRWIVIADKERPKNPS